MVKLTQSLAKWLLKYHRDKYVLITFGHLEDFTEDMKKEYLEWLETEEGKSYLKGGSNYDKEYAKRIGVDNNEAANFCPNCGADMRGGAK